MKEILCPAHKGISGKCNALLRKNYIYSFCSINEKKKKKNKIKMGPETGRSH